MTLITTNTHTGDSDATSDFTSGIDSTYKLYIFKFYDINPATDGAHFEFQANAVGASDYDESMQTTYFYASHDEADGYTDLSYHADYDQANGTSYQSLARGVGNGADECCAGTLWLFNPSNTTYVKHFYSTFNCSYSIDYIFNFFVSGYFNTTSAIDDIQFKFSSGNMDGTIKMYGVG